MIYQLRDHYYEIPKGGWKVIIPTSFNEMLAGVEVTGYTASDLVDKASQLFYNNRQPFHKVQFEELVCSQLPDPTTWCSLCVKSKDAEWDTVQPLTIKKVLNFFMTMARWSRSGCGFVPHKQAQARFDKCKACPHATRQLDSGEDCLTCDIERNARSFLLDIVKGLGTVDEEGDDAHLPTLYCKLCGCDLRAKVWFNIKNSCWDEIDVDYKGN